MSDDDLFGQNYRDQDYPPIKEDMNEEDELEGKFKEILNHKDESYKKEKHTTIVNNYTPVANANKFHAGSEGIS